MNESTTDSRIVPLPTGQDVLTEIPRAGARRMLARAIEAEVAAWIDDHAHLNDEAGHKQVVRNGHLPERTIQTGIGPLEVQQPRVRDRRPADRREAFTSAILPLPAEDPEPGMFLSHQRMPMTLRPGVDGMIVPPLVQRHSGPRAG